MAITLYLYSFSKRENSTKQPTGSGTSVSVTLLDDTSLMNPTFKLSLASNPIGYNYAYVADFGRYYFIQDISSHQNFWYISCTCDVLASYKTAIGSGTHYVLRSSSDSDGDISDSVYPAKINATMSRVFPQNNLIDWSNGHSFVLGVVGIAPSYATQIGSVVYYHMDDEALLAFMTYLMDNVDNWSDLSGEYSPGVNQALLNPMQYIVSCVCLPVKPPAGPYLLPMTIKFGYYEYTMPTGAGKIKVLDMSNPTIIENTTIDVLKHPQAATRGNYLNCQPFSEYVLHCDPFGDIPLDPTLLQENTELDVSLYIDMTDGTSSLFVQGGDNLSDVLFNGSAQIGININLSQVYVDGLAQEKVVTENIATMLTAAMTPDLSSFVKIGQAATAGIQDATRLNFPTVSGLANGGSFLSFFNVDNFYMSHKYFEVVDEDNDEIGRPLCQSKVINTLSGFILCQNADCQISGTQEEAQKINQYMNTGFFYE